MVMLMGLFLLRDVLGTLDMDQIGVEAWRVLAGEATLSGGAVIHVAGGFASAKAQLYTAGLLMLFGFGAKAGCFPLHIWLPKAHPVAPAPASALLSGILTKAGVFGIIILSCVMFAGDGNWGLLIAILGLVTMFLGALLAVFSVNLKRTLACSSVSQIGFIMTGIGMSCLLSWAGEGNLLAVRGAFLHMVNHSLIKLVLFLCAGAVFMNIHQLELNDIRGFGRKKPALCFCFAMGALGIGGIPLWNGYVSKTLLHESIVEYGKLLEEGRILAEGARGASPALLDTMISHDFWKGAEWVFLFTGGMTVAYMLKLFVALFVDRHPKRQAEFDQMSSRYMTPLSRAVLVGAAAILPVLGMVPYMTMNRIGDMGQEFFGGSGHVHEVSYFSFANLKGGLISIGIGVLLYAGVVRTLLMEPEAGQVPEGKESRGRRYVDRWPAWLDLENLIYRPLLQAVLPTVFTIVCRVMDHFTDDIVALARRTLCRQLPEPKSHPEGNWLAHVLGSFADGWARMRKRLFGEKDSGRVRVSAVHHLIEKEKRFKHIGNLVEQSFSFGLMLFCIGLCVTLGYLLFVYYGGALLF
jgi:hydrogenase-4 component B